MSESGLKSALIIVMDEGPLSDFLSDEILERSLSVRDDSVSSDENPGSWHNTNRKLEQSKKAFSLLEELLLHPEQTKAKVSNLYEGQISGRYFERTLVVIKASRPEAVVKDIKPGCRRNILQVRFRGGQKEGYYSRKPGSHSQLLEVCYQGCQDKSVLRDVANQCMFF